MPEPLATADGFECATCGHEWLADIGDGIGEVRDAHGTLLASGDDVIVIKELKLDAEAFFGKPVRKAVITVPAYFNAGDHPIDGKVNGRGILIKAEFVRKA